MIQVFWLLSVEFVSFFSFVRFGVSNTQGHYHWPLSLYAFSWNSIVIIWHACQSEIFTEIGDFCFVHNLFRNVLCVYLHRTDYVQLISQKKKSLKNRSFSLEPSFSNLIMHHTVTWNHQLFIANLNSVGLLTPRKIYDASLHWNRFIGIVHSFLCIFSSIRIG